MKGTSRDKAIIKARHEDRNTLLITVPITAAVAVVK
jgi:hypothetical protein